MESDDQPATMKCEACDQLLGGTANNFPNHFGHLYCHAYDHAMQTVQISQRMPNMMEFVELCFPNYRSTLPIFPEYGNEERDHDTAGREPNNTMANPENGIAQQSQWKGFQAYCGTMIKEIHLDEKGRVTCQICQVPIKVRNGESARMQFETVLAHGVGHMAPEIRYPCPECLFQSEWPGGIKRHAALFHNLRRPMEFFVEVMLKRNGGDRAGIIQKLVECYGGEENPVGGDDAPMEPNLENKNGEANVVGKQRKRGRQPKLPRAKMMKLEVLTTPKEENKEQRIKRGRPAKKVLVDNNSGNQSGGIGKRMARKMMVLSTPKEESKAQQIKRRQPAKKVLVGNNSGNQSEEIGKRMARKMIILSTPKEENNEQQNKRRRPAKKVLVGKNSGNQSGGIGKRIARKMMVLSTPKEENKMSGNTTATIKRKYYQSHVSEQCSAFRREHGITNTVRCNICEKDLHIRGIPNRIMIDHVASVHLRLPIFACRFCPMEKSCYHSIFMHLKQAHSLSANGGYDDKTDQYEKEILNKLEECFVPALNDGQRKVQPDQKAKKIVINGKKTANVKRANQSGKLIEKTIEALIKKTATDGKKIKRKQIKPKKISAVQNLDADDDQPSTSTGITHPSTGKDREPQFCCSQCPYMAIHPIMLFNHVQSAHTE